MTQGQRVGSKFLWVLDDVIPGGQGPWVIRLNGSGKFIKNSYKNMNK